MELDFKNKKTLAFLGFGILMVITVTLYSFFSIRFLIKNLNEALDKKAAADLKPLRFQVEKVEVIQRKN